MNRFVLIFILIAFPVSFILGFVFGYDWAYLEGKDEGRKEVQEEAIKRKYGYITKGMPFKFAWRVKDDEGIQYKYRSSR